MIMKKFLFFFFILCYSFTLFAEVTGNSGFGNMVYLSLSWNILKGHQHKVRRAEDINASLDDGIVK